MGNNFRIINNGVMNRPLIKEKLDNEKLLLFPENDLLISRFKKSYIMLCPFQDLLNKKI